MALDYKELGDTAYELLEELGQDVILNYKNTGTYNPSTNTQVSIPPSSLTIKGAVLNYKAYQIDGQIIKKNDLRLILESKHIAIEPSLRDTISISSESFSIMNIVKLNPAGVIVYYDIQLRK
jgi:hypothetical protein